MTRHSKLLALALTLSVPGLTSCTHGIFESPVYLSATIAPRPNAIPAGATVVFNATVSNQLSLPQWTLLNAGNAPAVGSLSAVAGSPNSISYTAPLTPPIYTGVAAVGFTQGTVTLDATVIPPVNSTLPIAHDAVTFFITSPTITVALSPSTASVALDGTQQFTAYAIGNVNNTLTWQVNGVTGGSISTGTITNQTSLTLGGLYTAPHGLPVTGNTVTVTAVSQADTAKFASSTVTLR